MVGNEAPRLEEFTDGLPEPEPKNEKPHPRIAVRIIIAVLALVSTFLAFRLAIRSQGIRVSGTGRIEGQVVNESGRPLHAQIFIIHTDLVATTDAEGYFSLQGVPAGEQTLVVGYQGVGREYPVTVPADGVVDMGQIRFISTRVPAP